MVINDLMDLIKKLFNDEYANIVIIDSSNREMAIEYVYLMNRAFNGID